MYLWHTPNSERLIAVGSCGVPIPELKSLPNRFFPVFQAQFQGYFASEGPRRPARSIGLNVFCFLHMYLWHTPNLERLIAGGSCCVTICGRPGAPKPIKIAPNVLYGDCLIQRLSGHPRRPPPRLSTAQWTLSKPRASRSPTAPRGCRSVPWTGELEGSSLPRVLTQPAGMGCQVRSERVPKTPLLSLLSTDRVPGWSGTPLGSLGDRYLRSSIEPDAWQAV